MGYFGIPFRNGVPIGLGSIVGFGAPQEFSPSELFLGGTAGAWYDPSDLTTLFTTSAGTTQCAMPGQGSAVSVGLMLDKSQNGVGTNGAKRVNLLTYSEDFSAAAWTKSGLNAFGSGSVANTTATLDPLGGNTADFIQENTANSTHEASQIFSVGSSVRYSYAVYVKAAGRNWCQFVLGPSTHFGTGGISAYFDLANGAVGTVTSNPTALPVATIQSVGNGWYLCALSATSNAAVGTADCYVRIAQNGSTVSYTGDGTSGIYIWGADLRLASEASTLPTYQRIDANWYSTMAGNHAIAFNDTTARPELRARVNLLRWSEVFDATASGSVWLNASVTVTDGALAPNGTNTADTITGVSGVTYPHVRQAITLPAAGTYKASCYFQKTSGATRFPAVEINFAPGNAWVILNTDTGVATNAQGTPTNISVSDAGGYWLLSFDVAVNITSATFFIYPASSSNGTTYAPNLTGSCVAWGADLRPANIGANVPAYQRIADANTYDTSGFPLYLRFDGIDDSMYTPANLNLSGTDKVAVFAGVRKLSDAAQGVVAELSATIASNNGTFLLAAPDGATQTYGWDSKGTTQVDAVASSLAAPRTNVLVGTADIAGDSCIIRVNGAVADTEAGDQGTGNYGTYPLFIGARNNASIWFNGHLHSLIIAGSAVSAGNISATEQWVAGKTGITI